MYLNYNRNRNPNRTLRSAPLLLAACLLFGAPVFAVSLNVRDFGAVGDGETLDHEAINAAILAAVEAGGGTVWIPAGDYLSGSIRLQSNIRLHLDAGATIIAAPQEMNAYDYTEDFIPPAYQDGGHTYFRNSLIWGIGLENVSITGTGVDTMTIDNVTIDTNRDGINLDACRNVMVKNSRINAPLDDAISPKSSYALLEPRITENITISNVVMTDVHRYGIFIASGKRNRTPNLTTVSRMRNIDISNVIMDGVDHRIGMTITGMEEQPIENLRLSNIRLVSRGGGELWRARIQLPDPTTPAARYPKVGWAGVMPVYGIYARHVNGLELSRVSYSFLEPDMRPVAHFENIDGLILDRVRGQISEGIPPVVVTEDVRNVTVLDSPLFVDMMETAPRKFTK